MACLQGLNAFYSKFINIIASFLEPLTYGERKRPKAGYGLGARNTLWRHWRGSDLVDMAFGLLLRWT